ncbi:MAG: ECF transporter S component [Candidatus Jordarchaeum sp.]|uniref:ECF transporter S component n=1 Tax=Candidatus Jordarchaeum sp. TaxID=2823881 RepID=UPI0040493A82
MVKELPMALKEGMLEALPRFPLSVNIALTGMMTALVCIATMAFQIYFPFSQGYINAGEGVIYVTALLFGPIIEGIAGGIGSMLANIFLGFNQYALGMLIFKGGEGLAVGFFGYKFRLLVKRWWKPLSIVMCTGIAGLILYLGISCLSGLAEIYGGVRPWWWSTNLFTTYFQCGWWHILVNVPWWAWLIISVCFGLLFLYFGLKVDASVGWSILAIFGGGILIILGYFIIEQFFLGLAGTNIAIIIGQILLGVMIAIPIEIAMRKITPEIFIQSYSWEK